MSLNYPLTVTLRSELYNYTTIGSDRFIVVMGLAVAWDIQREVEIHIQRNSTNL